ncbi:reverse transcriptase [Phytophthora megakarya]|uniref:Reverse transcriptase n=1 Tax=Phytophthora megakarya TaxID=4795 RepID=A0A225VIT2_9STRA|nr:reverse transcriptase [Phytophthora megakarya]
MVLGMPWLARHDPTIDWEKRTVVRFRRCGATESDGLVSAADTPNGASESPSETVARAAVSGRSARSARAVTTPGVVDSKSVSSQGPDTSRKFSAVRRRGDNSVSTLGVDTRSISESRKFSAVRRRGDNSVSTLGVDTRSISESRKFSSVRRRGDNSVSVLGVATHCFTVTTKHRLRESMRQAVRTVANAQH